MTGPQDSEATRPISVAELLAKNGTIGAAPPGGRRRRRRGNSDAVTVAELTGEIPILRTGELPVVRDEARTAEVTDDEHDNAAQTSVEPVVEPETEPERDAEPEPEREHEAEPDADTAATTDEEPPGPPELSDVPAARRGPAAKPERTHFPLVSRKREQRRQEAAAAAEMMSPDPIVDEPVLVDTAEKPDELGVGDPSDLQTYLRATSGPLFGGQTVADDLARRGTDHTDDTDRTDDTDVAAGDDLEVLEDVEVEEALEDETAVGPDADATSAERLTRGQMAVRALLIAAQSIVAVVFGAGMFIAFDQLWKWNSLIALILGVLVILGLVVGVRVVRKTEDIGSTLTAVAVGALVAFGPLALWQAS
ncbi:FUSC family protein [Mycolicibacterium mengxianglii]|uniref:FUSC family protein n=1 Tax=Mycolicibacterium mengxianglii TaxID=2736649 RepID=UPI0018D1D83A|nr:FUSC family protein [Mycolicibacterium mengxianglii]